MTQNQINYARNLEDARHNREMEKQGWHTAQSSRISAEAAQTTSYANAANADTNRKQLDINWYEAGTNARNATTREGELLAKQDEVELKRADLTRQYGRDMRDYILASQELGIKRAAQRTNEKNAETNKQNANTNAKNAATNRGNMWFSAASSVINNTIGNAGRIVRFTSAYKMP